MGARGKDIKLVRLVIIEFVLFRPAVLTPTALAAATAAIDPVPGDVRDRRFGERRLAHAIPQKQFRRGVAGIDGYVVDFFVFRQLHHKFGRSPRYIFFGCR